MVAEPLLGLYLNKIAAEFHEQIIINNFFTAALDGIENYQDRKTSDPKGFHNLGLLWLRVTEIKRVFYHNGIDIHPDTCEILDLIKYRFNDFDWENQELPSRIEAMIFDYRDSLGFSS